MPGGAEDVVAQDGLVGVDRIFALHCDPSLDAGQVGLRVGAITAAADQVEVTLSGRGGHTSRPHLTRTSRMRSPRSSPTCPACSRAGSTRAPAPPSSGAPCTPGGACNVIPTIGKVGGTLRMLDASVWEGVERLLEEVVHAVVAPYARPGRGAHHQGRAARRQRPRVHRRAERRRDRCGRPRRADAAVPGRRGLRVVPHPRRPAPWHGSAPARPEVRPTTCTVATSSSTSRRSPSARGPWPEWSSRLRLGRLPGLGGVGSVVRGSGSITLPGQIPA